VACERRKKTTVKDLHREKESRGKRMAGKRFPKDINARSLTISCSCLLSGVVNQERQRAVNPGKKGTKESESEHVF